MKIRNFLLLFVTLFHTGIEAKEINLSSPDKKLEAVISVDRTVSVKVSDKAGELFYIDSIVMTTDRGHFPTVGDRLSKVRTKSVSGTVVPPVKEKQASIPEKYNEATVEFSKGYALQFRLYNEGFAYRMTTKLDGDLTVQKENALFSFVKEAKITYQQDNNPSSSCESPYISKPVGELNSNDMGNIAALIELPASKRLLLLESGVQNYPYSWIKGQDGQVRMYHWCAPAAFNINNVDINGDIFQVRAVTGRNDYIAKVQGARTYPWRIVAIADTDADLMRNQLVYLLAPECQIDDPSWIKPGWVLLDWWARYGVYGVDFKSGVNTATAKYMIDFCSEYGIRYFLFDLGWTYKDDLTQVNPALDMEGIVNYAHGKGVDIILWVCYSLLDKQMEAAMTQFDKWGIKGLKIDFLDRSDQDISNFYWRAAAEAARYKMVVNFHGAYIPDGLRRAYPNVLTREALIEFENSGYNHNDHPDHHCTLPFIRNVAGPMDYIPGTMFNATKKNFRLNSDTPMGHGTRAHSMALAVIYESPMQMIPDAPPSYYKEEECARFLTRIPVEWDEIKPLDGKVGDYVAVARRNGNEWYMAAITDWDARKLTLRLDFLEEGKVYNMELIKDGPNAETMAVDYIKESRKVRKGDVIEADMASGGGWIAHIYF
jgi:alpha-glucosidase